MAESSGGANKPVSAAVKPHGTFVNLILHFLSRAYTCGVNLDPLDLYRDPVTFPAPPGSPSISSLISLSKDHKYSVFDYTKFLYAGDSASTCWEHKLDFQKKDPEDQVLQQYRIKRRSYLSVASLVALVWKDFAKVRSIKDMTNMACIFRDLECHSMLPVPQNGRILLVMLRSSRSLSDLFRQPIRSLIY